MHTKTIESRNAYKKQRNYCVSLLRKTKKEFYENLNPRLIADNKTFWKQVKPFFSVKTSMNRNITLLDGDKIISSPEKCAEIMNNFFSDAVLELDIDRSLYVDSVMNIINPVEKAIEMFKNHPSNISIYELGYEQNNFSFHPISELNIHTAINNIDSSKAYQKNNIPPKFLKENSDICAIVIRFDMNKCISKGKFSNNLKNADITPTFKKGDHLLKINYRAVSILPTLSKIYEKILYYQVYEYFDNIFFKYLSGFRKGHSTQHCLSFMLESLKKALDRGLCTGILLSINSLNLINDYLTDKENKERKWASPSVHGVKLYMVFHKAPYWDHYYLTSI